MYHCCFDQHFSGNSVTNLSLPPGEALYTSTPENNAIATGSSPTKLRGHK